VADIGCGHGVSTLLMAEAFPASRFFGFDYHQGSIEDARKAAAPAGLSRRAPLEVRAAKAVPAAIEATVPIADILFERGILFPLGLDHCERRPWSGLVSVVGLEKCRNGSRPADTPGLMTVRSITNGHSQIPTKPVWLILVIAGGGKLSGCDRYGRSKVLFYNSPAKLRLNSISYLPIMICDDVEKRSPAAIKRLAGYGQT